jgi:hypothetical protein
LEYVVPANDNSGGYRARIVGGEGAASFSLLAHLLEISCILSNIFDSDIVRSRKRS